MSGQWQALRELAISYFGPTACEFVETEGAFAGVASVETSLQDPNLCAFIEDIYAKIPPGGKLSVHHPPQKIVFLIGAEAKAVAALRERVGV